MDISAKMVSDLRKQTNAGMMDCKNALKECDGDMDQAADYLRTHGIAKAVKKEGRRDADDGDEPPQPLADRNVLVVLDRLRGASGGKRQPYRALAEVLVGLVELGPGDVSSGAEQVSLDGNECQLVTAILYGRHVGHVGLLRKLQRRTRAGSLLEHRLLPLVLGRSQSHLSLLELEYLLEIRLVLDQLAELALTGAEFGLEPGDGQTVIGWVDLDKEHVGRQDLARLKEFLARLQI